MHLSCFPFDPHILAQTKFNINGDMRVSVTLSDNFRTKMDKDNFCDIVRNFSKSGSFYVNLEYVVVQQNPARVTIEACKYNLITQSICQQIFNYIH